MRLYRILRWVGKVRKRMYPWFEAPAAGRPMRYDGWVWDPEVGDWVVEPVEKIEVNIEPLREPKPDVEPSEPLADRVPGWFWVYSQQEWMKDEHFRSGHYALEFYPPMPRIPPGRTQAAEVPGWEYNWDTFKWDKTDYERKTVWISDPWPPMPDRAPDIGFPDVTADWRWDYSNNEWVQITIYAESVEIEPPRSLPPDVDQAGLNVVFPLTEQYALFKQNLISQGLDPHQAERVARAVGDAVLKTIYAQQKEMAKDTWQRIADGLGMECSDMLATMTYYGLLGIVAFSAGVVIGYAYGRVVLPDVERVVLPCTMLTYLIGPDDWYYSENIGKSVEGQDYFSICDGIGTDLTRHKRSTWGFDIDNIDFPGGFIENGYQFPYWIKYTWEFWEVEYVGFLRSAGQGFYVLKPEAKHSGPFWPGYMSRKEIWCREYRYYL